MKHPCPNMLLRIAQADAFAASLEYTDKIEHKASYDEALQFDHYFKHPRREFPVGFYTDDTQMSIAVAEVLLSDIDLKYVRPYQFLNHFFKCFKRDSRDGYSRALQGLLETCETEEEFAEKINPFSDRNGAMMRSCPLGVIYNIQDIFEVADMQASATHYTDTGILTSQAVALMSHFSLYEDEPLSKVYQYVETHMGRRYGFTKTMYNFFDQARQDPTQRVAPPDVALKTLSTCIHICSTATSLIEAMKMVINIGGDTDTVASIVWGVMAPRHQEEKLPEFFYTGLENGTYGREFLMNLGNDLMYHYHYPCLEECCKDNRKDWPHGLQRRRLVQKTCEVC